MKNFFDQSVSDKTITRINLLSNASQPKWGRMTVAQMLAHCSVMFEMIFSDKHPQASFLKKIFLKVFVKNIVIGEKPYPKHLATTAQFLITDSKQFDDEKERLIGLINKTQKLGGNYFKNKISLSFGKLSEKEWSNMLYKHLDHHLKQFGV